MKKALPILFLLLLLPLLFGFQFIGGRPPAAGGGGDPTPDFQYNLEDNTSGTTVSATEGTDGTLAGESNTSDVHSTDSIEGSGSFELDANDTVYFSPTAAIFNDEVFTLEFALKGDTGGTDAYARLVSTSVSNGFMLVRQNADTTLRLYVGGTWIGDYTVTDFDDSQWHTFRIVVDGTNDVCIYQKVESGSWGSGVCDSTDPGDITIGIGTMYLWSNTGSANFWGSNSGGYKGDAVKLWDSAEAP